MKTEQLEKAQAGEVDTSRLPVGAALRARREQLGWSLGDLAAWLRIRHSYLEALEAGQATKLPGPAYALGFLRAYSGALGLDAEDMSRRFRNETKDINRKPELSFPAPVPERGVPAGAVVLLGAVVVIGAYAAWYQFTGHERVQPHVIPAVPAALAPLAAAPSASPQVATVMPGPGQVPSPLTTPAAQVAGGAAAGSAPTAKPVPGPAAGPLPVVPTMPAPGAAPGAASAPVAGAAALPPTASVPGAAPPTQAAPVSAPASTATGPAAPPATTPAAPPLVPGQIVLKATAASWVQVRQAGGKVLYDHVLQPGDSWTVPADAGAATLTTGNAGGVTLSADGTTTPPLGRLGAVRRNIPLDVASIRDGLVATATPAAAAESTPLAPEPPAAAPGSAAPASAASPMPAMHHPTPPSHRAAMPSAASADHSADSLNARQLQATPAH